MQSATSNGKSHSADVRMELRVNGSILSVAQLGPDFIVLRTPVDQPPVEAEMTLWIDGHEDRWPVWLDDGISAGQPRTRISQFLPTNGT
jgi:hypothetical protein